MQLEDVKDHSGWRKIQVESMIDLLTGKRLGSDIVNAYMAQLVNVNLRDTKVYRTIDTFWIVENATKGSLTFGKDVIHFWPLHHQKLEHWTLLTIQEIGDHLLLHHYDSLGMPLGTLDGIPRALKYLSSQSKKTLTAEHIKVVKTPRQYNAIDCGVFALAMAKRLVLGLKIDSDENLNVPYLRNEIGIELVSNIILVPNTKNFRKRMLLPL